MGLPAIFIDLAKLQHNALLLKQYSEQAGVACIPVTKGTGAHETVIKALYEAGFRTFADSRLHNLERIRQMYGRDCKLQLLRLPAVSEVSEVVRLCDASLNSEVETIVRLGDEAQKLGIQHDIILMVDLGDLREGILPEHVKETVRRVKHIRGIHVSGLGVNFTCYGGIIPTESSLEELSRLAEDVERVLGYNLDIISGGNSSTLPLLLDRKEIGRVNQIRIGEAMFLGQETAYGQLVPGLYPDVFVLKAEIVELQCKPSYPIGEIGRDAFGNIPSFVDYGHRIRAILAIGKQDVDVTGMSPIHSNMRILGASSDHLILDVTDGPPLKVGDVICFHLNYSSLLRLMTSPYVSKEVTQDSVLMQAL